MQPMPKMQETKSNVPQSISQQLLARLQDYQWHFLNEFTIANRATLGQALISLRKQGYVIQVCRANGVNTKVKYRLMSSDADLSYHGCDNVDLAILERLHKHFKRNKIHQAARIFLEICDETQVDKTSIVFYKLSKLRRQKYVASVRQRASNSRELLYWKIAPKGLRLLEYLAREVS